MLLLVAATSHGFFSFLTLFHLWHISHLVFFRIRTRKLVHDADTKHRVVHVVSHIASLSSALNCIIGMSSLLQETNLDPMQEESVKMIVTSGQLLSTCVDDVLDFSKLEAGKVEVVIREINLQETLNSVVHSIETKCLSKGLRLCTNFDDPTIPEMVTTDSRRLQQILFNLLVSLNEIGCLKILLITCSRFLRFAIREMPQSFPRKAA